MRDIVLMIITFVCAGKALVDPVFGVLAFICYGLLGPQGLTWFFAREFHHSLLIGACTVVGFLTYKGAKQLPMFRETIAIMVLWLIFALSTLFSIEQDFAFSKLMLIAKIFLMVFLSMAILKTRDHLHMLLRAMALSLGFYAIKGTIFFLKTSGDGMVEGPPGTFLTANNTIGAALAMNVPLLFFLIRMEKNVWMRRLIKVMMIASYPAVLGTYSRGAWVALAAVTALLVMKSRHKVRIVVIGTMLVVLCSPMIPLFMSERLTQRVDSLQNVTEENSAIQRFGTWEFCARVGLANPLVGVGFDYYSIQMYEEYYPEFAKQWEMHKKGYAWSCHSMWFTVLGEHGVFAFVLWIGLFASCFLSVMSIRRHGQRDSEMSWIIDWADMIKISLIGFAIGGTFLDLAYFDLYYMLIGAMLIIKQVIKERNYAQLNSVTAHTKGFAQYQLGVKPI